MEITAESQRRIGLRKAEAFFRKMEKIIRTVDPVEADGTKRIAAPMVGNVVTSPILELVLYPVIYLMLRGREKGGESPIHLAFCRLGVLFFA